MKRLLACFISAVLLAACSPRSETLMPAAGTVPAMIDSAASSAATGTVKVTILVPAIPPTRARYVSHSTKSITIKAYTVHGKTLASKTFNLRAGTKSCKATPGGVVCTFEMTVTAGKDRFDATTYDQANGKGNALSALSNLARTVKAGKTVKLPLALYGIPRSVGMALTDDSKFESGNSSVGFQFAGLIAHTMQVFAYDADDNVIMGSGAPKFGVVSSDTADLSIAAVSGSTNAFLLTPHGDASGITLTASAKPPQGVTVQTSAGLTIGSVLYVANYGSATPGGNVTAYAPWSAGPIETITTGMNNPAALAVDSKGNLWVGNNAGAVPGAGSFVEYAPGSTAVARTISGITEPNVGGGHPLAVDASGDLYCACNGVKEVDEFTPSGGSTASRSLTSTTSPTGISAPYSVVTDSSGKLYVANVGSNTVGVSVFGPTGTTPLRNITNGISGVWLLAFDKVGNLYAGNQTATPNTITEYAPGSGNVLNTFGSASGLSFIVALAVDRSGNAYGSNYSITSPSTSVEYTLSSKASPARTFSTPGASIFAIATDPFGNVYFAVEGNSTVVVYPPGTSTTATRTLTSADGIDTPWYVATWP